MYGNTQDWSDDEPSAADMHRLCTINLGGDGHAYGEWEVTILKDDEGSYWADGREGMLEGPFKSLRQTFLSVGLGDYQFRKWRDPGFLLRRAQRKKVARRMAAGPNPMGERTSIWTRTWQERPNYFGDLSRIEFMLSRIKSDAGRVDLAFGAMNKGFGAAWPASSLPATPGHSDKVGAYASDDRLPDLALGQVEIARVTHCGGKVTSLRAARIDEGPAICLELVGQHKKNFRLASPRRPEALTEAEVLAVFREALPGRLEGAGRVTSFFYRALMCPDIADALRRGGEKRFQRLSRRRYR